MSQRENGPSRPNTGRKKRYHPPELTVHGNLRTLTRAKKGKKSDGARKPATRTNGGNA